MSKFKQKNNWAIDLHLHIPIPSVSISISGSQETGIKNSPLEYTSVIDVEDEESTLDSSGQ